MDVLVFVRVFQLVVVASRPKAAFRRCKGREKRVHGKIKTHLFCSPAFHINNERLAFKKT
jgi:hypothetical protein